MSLATRQLPGRYDLLALAAADPSRFPALLESAAPNARARHDVLFALPRERIVARRGDETPFLARLDAAWRAERIAGGDDATLPFRGGWCVLLTYELAREAEPSLELPDPPADIPVAVAVRCAGGIVYDHARDLTTVFAEREAAAELPGLVAALSRAPERAVHRLEVGPIEEEAPRRFLDGVARIARYLEDGDVFQVNLSRAWQAGLGASDPADVYRALRRANPSPFAGLFRHEGLAVLSSSPERLVAVRGREVATRPIAGTRPRHVGDDHDARVRELIGHPKERAEHVMLIDLERNDLGRVCVPGSVEVDELMTVESYAHVHHIVSNVRGTLRPDATPGDVIRAVFPGGTITGCPKVRCMEVIAELEREGRGPYTGALGYLDRDGDMDFNILIRTIWIVDGVARFRAGSGIVADSDPARELEETRAKARGLVRALEPDAP
ncbi:MAG TPA: aminodeoxychorismate synthase component I [Xanthomonadales bacterium]|nr:aminodeoxychorismate synthase component I [Xanthomonadales bacterium]